MNNFDIDTFGQMLLDRTRELETENQELKERLMHLEDLLLNLPAVGIGS